MCRRIIPLIFFNFMATAYTDSAIQTDWSGGPGILGPVIEWSDQFYFDTNVEWDSIPGEIELNSLIAEHTVDCFFDGPLSVYSEDINGDGYMDILGASSVKHDITWWENVNGSGTSWTIHIVDKDFNGARSVYSEDIDGDGDMDILGAAISADEITWWENEDGLGTLWTEHTIDWYFSSASSVYSEDIDGDNDMDVLGAAMLADDITWWENIDGLGTSWIEHTVDGAFNGAHNVYSEDVDGDGDMDVLGAAFYGDDITWWENIDGSGTSWIEHTVHGDYNTPTSVYSDDIDGDGDMDILGTSHGADDVTWWENIDGSGTSWIEHTIDGDFDSAQSAYSEDVDGDGDMDILGAGSNCHDITWWENIDGSGTSWIDHTVDGDYYGAISVYAEDVDGNGDMDVIGASLYDNEITWWDLTPAGWVESSILYTQNDPDWQWIEWTCSTPPRTSISFQVRASDDYMNMGIWSDTLSAPSSLEGILIDNDSYFQYKAILQTSDPGTTPILNDITVSWDPVSIADISEPIPPGLALLHFSPNPASAPAVRFSLPESASVTLSIFDLSGRQISVVTDSEYSMGYHDILLGDLSPGTYFCRMISGDFSATQRFVVIE